MSVRTSRNNRRPKPGGPSEASLAMLLALQSPRRPMYEGTVPARVKARRRAANRAARISRRVNRNG